MTIRRFNGIEPKIAEGVYIDPQAVIIGDVTLGAGCSIWPTAVIRGDVESIVIGENTNIQDGAVLHVSHAGDFSPQGHPLNIGKGVTIGHKAIVHACTVGDFCLIGMGAIIMDDAVLEDYVMLGAGALVPSHKHLFSGYLYLGAPVKAVRLLTESEKAFLRYSSEHYLRLKNQYLNQSNDPINNKT